MLAAAVAVGGGVGFAAAQEDDDIPSLPAAYHGELTAADESLDAPVRLEAVADGDVQESIIVDADGSIGGPTISDEKLTVQEPEDQTVEFQIGGEVTTVQTLDGDQINDESIPWESETQEIELQIDSKADIPSSVDLSITDTNSPVEAEDTLTVTVEIENTGPIEVSPDIELQDGNNTVVDSTETTVPIDETVETTLSWTTTSDDVGTQDVAVTAENETASTDVEIESPDIADPGNGDDSGGQGGAVGVAPPPTDDDEADDTDPTDGEFETTETQMIVASDEFGISQVRFTEATSLASITWDTPTIPQELATVETYDHSPDGVPAVPGNVLTVSDVSLPANATDEPATVEFRADQAAIDDAEATPDELTVARLVDDSWEPLDTNVTEETNNTVLLEADTPGFSNFAVTTSSPTAEIDAPDSASSGSEVTVSGSNSTTPFGEIVSYEWSIDGETHTGERVTTTVPDDESTVELTVENDAGDTHTTTQTLTTTDDSVPGFGVIAALSALLAATLLLYRRV